MKSSDLSREIKRNQILQISTCIQDIHKDRGVPLWALTRETLSSRFANNKDAEPPVHLHSLISAFIIISKLATSEFSILELVSVAEYTGLNLTLSETPKTEFVALKPICSPIKIVGIINQGCVVQQNKNTPIFTINIQAERLEQTVKFQILSP